MEVAVDGTWGRGRPVGGVDASVDGAFACMEANVGPGVGVSGVCVETAVGGSGVFESAGNGVVAAPGPGVAAAVCINVAVDSGVSARANS